VRNTIRFSVIGFGLLVALQWPTGLGGAPLVLAENGVTPTMVNTPDGMSCSAVIQIPRIPTVPGEYYGVDLVATKRVPGTGQAMGVGSVTFAKSPFGIAVSPSGHYVYDIDLSVERLRQPKHGFYTAWITTPTLDKIKRLGVLSDEKVSRVSGQVDWNKFLVVVTLEPSVVDNDRMWVGPIIMRGISRSGLMHTMAGHGPFEREPCQKYGYR